ncbi:bifunctional DNA primase/polymerase [Halalkalicoccus salilacus]|uniref:bifunctional DNA primase/polymerase n=1 Tax=Halalkalicoccus salilacus TaxID=3117459 RepID=UPI00300ED553
MSDAGDAPPPETLTVDQWRHVVDSLGDPWYSEVSDAVAGALGITTPKADDVIDAAVADGTLSVDKTGAYWRIGVNEPEPEPGVETADVPEPASEPEPEAPPAPRLGAQVDPDVRREDHDAHDNPLDASAVSDAERARMLLDYIEAFRAEFGTTPKLMPVDPETKRPEAEDWYSVVDRTAAVGSDDDGKPIREKTPTTAAFARVVDAYEAARQIAEEGAHGFALYADVPDFGTGHVAFVDHDDDAFPTPAADPTLEVLSGSGRGRHETYRNDPDDPVANARVGSDLGEIRADYWYVITPGSIHPSGGVYHVVEDREIATLSDADLEDDMRPAAKTSTYTADNNPALENVSGYGEMPDDDELTFRLEAAFANPDDGERIEQVYHGDYESAGFSDRSGAERWLARRIDAYVGLGDAKLVAQCLNSGNLQKWSERTDDAYRNSILGVVGSQDWYFNPDGGDEVGESERAPVSTVPFAYLETLNTTEARETARKRGLQWPTTDDVRERLSNAIHRNMRAEQTTVIRAPTSSGKSHAIATEPWLYRTNITGDAPVVQLAPTKDARDENVWRSKKAGVNCAVLMGRTDRCPIARGDHDPSDDDRDDPETVITVGGVPASDWFEAQCGGKGLPFQLVHAAIDEQNDQDVDLPCVADGGECPAVSQWDGVPRDDDGNPTVDVVHATHHFAYVPSIRAGTNVIFDEQPSAFSVDLHQSRIERAVRAYLLAIGAPVTSYWSLLSLAESDGYRDGEHQEREELEAAMKSEDAQPDREWYIRENDAHALAPALTRAIYRAARYEDPDANGRRTTTVLHAPPRFDADGSSNGTAGGPGDSFLTIVLQASRVVSARNTPGLMSARSVIGLDAHPSRPLWQRNVHPDINTERIMNPLEHRLWRRFERGLTAVQVGDATYPRAGENAIDWDENDRKLPVLITAIRERFGDDFRTAITTKQIKDALGDRLRDAGIPEPETMHYGEETSNNSFAGESVGLVNGCMDPGDDYVINLLAELDLDAWPERVDPTDVDDPTNALCAECYGRTCQVCGGTGLKRAKGRGFDGPDVDTAAEILASVRENRVAQAVGRYARNADDPDDSAIVFVRTNAVPDDLIDVRVNGVEWIPTGIQREIAHALADRPDGATAKGVADDIGCSTRHARATLAEFERHDVVEREKGAGPNPDRWRLTADTTLDVVDIGPNDADSSTPPDSAQKPEESPTKDLVGGSSGFSPELGHVSGQRKCGPIDALTSGGSGDRRDAETVHLDRGGIETVAEYAALDPLSS